MEKYLNEAFAYIHFHFGAWGSLGGICIYFHQKWSVVDSRQYVWVFFSPLLHHNANFWLCIFVFSLYLNSRTLEEASETKCLEHFEG